MTGPQPLPNENNIRRFIHQPDIILQDFKNKNTFRVYVKILIYFKASFHFYETHIQNDVF
jgi:hypothetical protein